MKARTISLVGILGAVVAILGITGAVVLRANSQGTATGFLAIVTPTLLALLGLLKTELVQNDVLAIREEQKNVSEELAELTNGKMHQAVHEAVNTALTPVVEKLTEDHGGSP